MKLHVPSSVSTYKKQYLKHDILAALVVTAITIPESLGFAIIVGLPPVTGLYTALLAPIVFGLVAHTRRLVVGADSATAALIASGAVLVAQSGTVGYANAVGVIGLLTAAFLLLFGVFRMGYLADLISRPVMIGFLAGVGLQLIVTKFPAMLGIPAAGTLWQHLTGLVEHVGLLNGMTLTVSILVVGVVLTLRRSRIPGELLGVALATLFAFAFHIDTYGVALVGALPSGLPDLMQLHVTLPMIIALLPTALSIAIVILAQSSTVIRGLGSEHDEKVRPNRDLIALGVANIASSLTHGFAVNGSPPRSVAADLVGGKSQLVNVFMGLIIGVLLLFGSSLFVWMPEAALASIVCILGVRLIRFRDLLYLWDTHRVEFFVAMIALVGTALFGVLQGILIAVVVSLMERLARQHHPRDDILLRDGELSKWAADRVGDVDSQSKALKHVLVYSFDGSLFFENIYYFVHRVRRAIARAHNPVKSVIIDASAIDSLDYTAAEELKLLCNNLQKDKTELYMAHVSPSLRQQLDDYRLSDIIGDDHILPTLASALRVIDKPKH